MPKVPYVEYFKWNRNDNIERCWIFKSLKENIAGSLIHVKSAKSLWDDSREVYINQCTINLFD